MATRKCPNGHQYDVSIYGDQCPFCPSKKAKPASFTSTPLPSDFTDGKETVIQANSVQSQKTPSTQELHEVANEGRTVIRSKDEKSFTSNPHDPEIHEPSVMYGSPVREFNECHTIIKTKNAVRSESSAMRRLVGLLVSYDANPAGEVYKLYEGRNVVGRSTGANISFPSDNFMSSQHLVILYKDGGFEAIDLNTSNHSYLNGNMFDETYLRMNDVLTIGNTKLIFFPIPRI